MPAFVGRAARRDVAHERAFRLVEAEARRQIARHALHRDAEQPAMHAAVGHELVHHVLRHVRRHREADADVAARRRQDLRVDADQLARGVHERAAGVALVDRRIGLQEVFIASVAEAGRAALRADDAHRHRLADAERVADREHDVADAHRVRIADRHDRQVLAVDLDHREIARRIRADQLAVDDAAIRQLDLDLRRVVDDVIVGQDVAVAG